jgi:hypothetical protein
MGICTFLNPQLGGSNLLLFRACGIVGVLLGLRLLFLEVRTLAACGDRVQILCGL